MKISLSWLNTYLDRPIDAEEAERLLTHAGFPIEGCEPVLDGRDLMLDVEVTSNRPDVLSHIGVAREIAARGGRALQAPPAVLPEASGPGAATLASVSVREPALCPAYTARVITGVKVGPSPDWLRDAVEAVGGRSVNNVVDVTNYVLLEMGQPLHAFDLGKLAGKGVVVRHAAEDEPFSAIDGTRHKLRPHMLVIADEAGPVAVAGVMGGKDSEVGDHTVDLLIESADFDALSVRRASRQLKLHSDSSFRFERGVDPRGVDAASRRACELILKVAGGTLAEGVVRVGDEPGEPRVIQLRPQRTAALLGVDLPAEAQAAYLDALGIQTRVAGATLTATVPSYRLDLAREVDLIEEIARQHGLDNIPLKDTIDIVAHRPQDSVRSRRVMTEVLVAHGYHETITPSLMQADDAAAFVASGEPASLTADMRRQDNTLRPTVLPSLLACRKLNQDGGNTAVKLFEIASGWSRQDGQVVEGRQLAMLCDAPDAQAAVSALKGTVAELVHALGGESAARGLSFEPVEDAWCQPAAEVRLGSAVSGRVGLLKPALTSRFDLQTPVASALICLEKLSGLYPPSHSASALPKYPAIERDLSVIVQEQVPWQAIERAVADAQPDLLESTVFVGTYRGKQVGKGRKSVTLRMQFRDPDRTLRHDQVDPQVEAVVTALTGKVGAALRA